MVRTLSNREGSPGGLAALAGAADRYLNVIFPLPSLLVLALVVAVPMVWLLWLSLNSWSLLSPRPMEFVGLANYAQLFQDVRFLGDLRTTAIFTISSVTVQMLLGLALALLLNRTFLGEGIARTAILMPMMATPVAIVLIWRIMFNPSIGFLNWLLRQVGYPGLLWVSHPATALPSLIMVDVLRETPFTVMILVAGLAALPYEPYEAARIDGASSLQSFWYLTLPLLRSSFAVALIFRAIATIKVFDIIYVLTNGGPEFSTETFAIFAYLQAFNYFQMGYAAAAAVVFFLLTGAITVPIILWRRKQWEY